MWFFEVLFGGCWIIILIGLIALAILLVKLFIKGLKNGKKKGLLILYIFLFLLVVFVSLADLTFIYHILEPLFRLTEIAHHGGKKTSSNSSGVTTSLDAIKLWMASRR